MTRIGFLGPLGTFTHQAVLAWSTRQNLGGDIVPFRNVPEVYTAITARQIDYGVVAIESSIEGYVLPSLDGLIAQPDLIAVDQEIVQISFDAFHLPGDSGPFETVSAHPHGLAQCQGFIAERSLGPVPAESNAAACRDLVAGQVSLGPAVCGELYGLATLATSVEDFHGGKTKFLVVTRRDNAVWDRRKAASPGYQTLLALTPHVTGPGVLARITRLFADSKINLSSFFSRPIKGASGTYIFVLQLDAAPWQAACHQVFTQLLECGDNLKTLGIYPGAGDLAASLSGSGNYDEVAVGSVSLDSSPNLKNEALKWQEPVA